MVVLTNFAPPEEGVRCRQPAVSAYVKDRCLGAGTLFIAESRVSWQGGDEQGFSLEYPGITLHAVSRDTTVFAHECLYLQLDSNIDREDDGTESNDSATEDDQDQESRFSEVRFVPEDKSSLSTLYKSMSDCQALHPDPDALSEDEAYYDDEEGQANLTPEGQARLAHLEGVFSAGDREMTEQQQGGNRVNGHGDMDTDDTGNNEQFEDADM